MTQQNKSTGYPREIRRQVGESVEHVVPTEYPRIAIKKRKLVREPPPDPKKQVPCYGTIVINLKGGKNLAGLNKVTKKSDPYVVLSSNISPFTWKSEWKWKTLKPVWNQSFCFNIHKQTLEGTLTFTVYDYNRLGHDGYIGRLDIPLYDIFTAKDGILEGWMPLTYESRHKKKTQDKGKLELSIKFNPKPLPKASTLDLNAILQKSPEISMEEITHEKSGAQHHMDSQHVPPPRSPPPVRDSASSSSLEPTVSIVDPVRGKYTLAETLGEGSFGIVKKGINNKSKEEVAIKIITKNIEADAESIKYLAREIQILHLVQNKYCVSFIESQETPENIYIVMELISGGDLLDAILEHDCFTEERAQSSMYQILKGIEYLHSKGISHRDLKPDNVLLDKVTNTWKIADFGAATRFTPEKPHMTEFEGTVMYMAPEILVGSPYTCAVDIWAMGVICYIMLSGCFPWEGDTDGEIQESIMDYNLEFVSPEFDDVSSDGMAFIMRLLDTSAEKRMTLPEAFSHNWLKHISM